VALVAVAGVAFEDGLVRARLLPAEAAESLFEPWSNLDIRASSRDLWGVHAGKHRGRVWIALDDGWWAIRLIEGDDERMARGVMRHVLDCVGRSKAVLESRLAELDSRYRVELLPLRERDWATSPFHELTLESQFEALLSLRLHVIEATGLDDLDEDTTVLEALREQASEALGDQRERLRHACAFELAIGRYLGAEALRCADTRTRAARRARMHEAFDAACKAFSEFTDAEGGADSSEVRPCSIVA